MPSEEKGFNQQLADRPHLFQIRNRIAETPSRAEDPRRRDTLLSIDDLHADLFRNSVHVT